MASKKLKLLSGLLSFTAIASMTGAPVLANEFLHNPLSGSETQDTEEAQKSLSILTEDTNRKMKIHRLILPWKKPRKRKTAGRS